MQQFQVPQFITIEDKIIGPLTFKQFVYLLAGGAIVVIIYFLLSTIFWLFLIIAAPIVVLTLALAFFKYNEQPFPKVIVNLVGYYLKPRLYIWKNPPKEAKKPAPALPIKNPYGEVPKLTESKLNELAWSLDIKEKVKR